MKLPVTVSALLLSSALGLYATCDTSNPLALETVVSRKTHGTAGDFDVVLFDSQHPLSAPGVECRDSSTATLVFTFSNTLQSVTSANVVEGAAQVDSKTVVGNQCIVQLSNIGNEQDLVVTLQGVHDSKDYISVSVPMNVLIGDTTANNTVNASDVTQVKAASGVAVDASNFRCDLTVNGTINASDVSLVKAKSGTAIANPLPAPPLSTLGIDASGRFLKRNDGNGNFFWLGDTCWWLMNASDADVLDYLSTRAAQGFNGIQVMALMLKLPNSLEPQLRTEVDYYGNAPRDSQGDLDPVCPNSAYWSRFKWIVEQAGRKGLYVGVFLVHGQEIPAYFGTSTSSAHDYARELAILLQDKTNVWYSTSVEYDAIHNYDYQNITPAEFAMFDSLAAGVVDGNQTSPLLRSIHPGKPQTSVTQFAPGGSHPVSWLDFHMLQSGHSFERGFPNGIPIRQTDELIDGGYALSSPKPIFDGEPIYENIVDRVWNDQTTTENSRRADVSIVRFKAYEAVFAGAFGHTYAHENTDYLWTVGDDHNRPFTRGISWQTALTSTGATQLKHLRDLMECHSQNRIPDQAMIHDSEPPNYDGLVHKRGTRESGTSARYALVYLPQGGSVTVDVTNLANDWAAKWFNPEDGTSTSATYDSHTGNDYVFSSPSARHPGDPVKDWILILESSGTFPGCDP